jgi:hypothetical protein
MHTIATWWTFENIVRFIRAGLASVSSWATAAVASVAYKG